MHQPVGRYRLPKHRKFDVVCCTLIFGCERRTVCAKVEKKLGLRLGLVTRLGLDVDIRCIGDYRATSKFAVETLCSE